MDKLYIISATCGYNNFEFKDVEESLNKYEKELRLVHDALKINYNLADKVYYAIGVYEDYFMEIVRIILMNHTQPEIVYKYANKFTPTIYYKDNLN